MGTLVFQATLGGAVNIIGPNIANTINFTLPSADGTSGQTWTTNGSGLLTFGTLGVAGGGTGLTTLATGSLAYGAGTSAFSALAIGTAGQILTVNSGATAPQWSTLTGVAVTTFSAGTTGFTPSSATAGAVTLAGTLATTNGGTGLTAFTSNQVFYASSTSAFAQSANLTFNGTTLTANTIGAFTLGGTVSGGGNQINNVIIGTSTPLAGAFTSLTASTTLGVTGVSTLTGGAVIEGMTVGKGAGGFGSNTTVGLGAFASNSSGASCIAIGRFALNVNSTGSNNTGIGKDVLISNTTASNLTAVGYQALYSNSTSPNNTALGYQAGYSLTTSATGANTFIGYQAGQATTSAQNVFVGSNAGNANTTGTNQVFIGHQAGLSNTTGTNNVFLGQSAGKSTTGSSNIFIGSGVFTVSDGSGNAVTTGSKNVILGNYTGSAAPISATGSNFVVLSDGDGNIVASAKTAQTFALQGGTLSSGTGIAFPATQSASSDANTLDDYEEGTWTPVLWRSAVLDCTYTEQSGTYTKIGNIVRVSCKIRINVINAAGSGTNYIDGLPFVPNYTPYTGGFQNTSALGVSIVSAGNLMVSVFTRVYFIQSADIATGTFTSTGYVAGGYLYFSMVYSVG